MSTTLQGQTLAEWFNQKKTQRKYLLDQIAALQVYSGYLRNGYLIARNGLGSIGSSVHDEFDLHQNYYRSLKLVKPALGESADPETIRQLYDNTNTTLSKLDRLAIPDQKERGYISSVKLSVLRDCEENIELFQHVNSGHLSISDHDRLSRNELVRQHMEDNYRFAKTFVGQVQSLLSQRKQGNRNLVTLKQLYGYQ